MTFSGDKLLAVIRRPGSTREITFAAASDSFELYMKDIDTAYFKKSQVEFVGITLAWFNISRNKSGK